MSLPVEERPRPTSGAVKWVVLALFLAGAAAFGIRVQNARRDREAQTATPTTQTPVVTVEAPVVREMVDGITLTGIIRPDKEVDVFARQPGRVERLLVKLGDRVKAGQLLAVIEHREVEWQARQADAQVMVADANVEQAQNGVEAANRQLERLRTLARDHAVTAQDLERAELNARAAETTVKLASAQRELSKAQAGLAATAFDNSRVTSPIGGIVVQRLVHEGSQVSPATPLFKVQDAAQLRLEGSVSGTEYAQVHVGQPTRVQVDELGGEAVTGTVTTVTPTLDPVTRRAYVEITIVNDKGRLLPNMFARATVEVARREGVLSVAERAIITDDVGPMVFVLRDGQAQQLRPRVGASDGQFVAVREGLTEKDLVIVAGHNGLQSGAAVRVAGKDGK